ncbi:MAG: ComEC/Rec2 family competence protein, partial [Acutalibacter sp.]
MVRPFALVGLSGYGALVLCAALGPGSAWALALLCLGLACVTLACRACLGFAAQRKGLLTWEEPSDVYPRALALFQGLFWVAAALAVAGGLCGMLAFRWQQAEPVQALAGEKRTLRAQVLDYPQERYHRYYYRLQVEALGQEGGPLEEVGPFTLRLSATMPLACQPFDWVECAVTFTAFDSGGGLYSTLNSRLADGFQAGAYLSQYQGIVVEENPSQPPGELLARMRRQVGRALDKLLPRREAGFLRAMVLGDGSGISETDMGNFRELGVSHILVVSGMHMTVLAAFLQLALKRLPIRKAVGNLL